MERGSSRIVPYRPAAFWLGLLVALILFVTLVQSVLLPFVAGMAVAYFLDPVADRLEALGLKRWVAATVPTVVFFIILVVSFIFLIPVIQKQIADLIAVVPKVINYFSEDIKALVAQVSNGGTAGEVKSLISEYSGQVLQWLARLIQQLWTSSMALFNLLSLLLITPVVAFYLLRDWDLLTAKIDGWLPRHNLKVIRTQFRDIHEVLSGVVRGQSLICLFLAVFYAIGLSAAGLHSGMLVGIITGAIAFIPLVGTLTGFALSTALAIWQFGNDFTSIGVVVAIFLAGQILESAVLTPKLIGGHAGLHPVWVIFALLVGGALYGVVGMLLSLPVAAAIGVLVRFGLETYLNSPYYLGPDSAQDQNQDD